MVKVRCSTHGSFPQQAPSDVRASPSYLSLDHPHSWPALPPHIVQGLPPVVIGLVTVRTSALALEPKYPMVRDQSWYFWASQALFAWPNRTDFSVGDGHSKVQTTVSYLFSIAFLLEAQPLLEVRENRWVRQGQFTPPTFPRCSRFLPHDVAPRFRTKAHEKAD